MVSAHRFWENKQQEGEPIDQFVTKLKTRAKSCEFGDQHDTMLRDRIVFGVSDTQLKERLLRESSDLTLEKAASLCRAVEASKNQLKELHSSETKPVHAVKSKSKQKHSKKPRQQQAFNCKKLELNTRRKLVLRLEGFVCFTKRKTTTPKCVHKRIFPSTWSIQDTMPPVVDKSSQRNYLSRHWLAHEVLKIQLGFPICLSVEQQLNSNWIPELKPTYYHLVFTLNSGTNHINKLNYISSEGLKLLPSPRSPSLKL